MQAVSVYQFLSMATALWGGVQERSARLRAHSADRGVDDRSGELIAAGMSSSGLATEYWTDGGIPSLGCQPSVAATI